MAKKATAESGVRRLEDSQEYVEAKSRLEAVSARKLALDAKLLEMMDEGRQKEVARTALDRAAQAVLEGRNIDQAALIDENSFRETERELRAVERAVQIASQAYEAVWKRASGEVIASRRQEHVEIVRGLAEHLEGLVDAVAQETAWIDSLRDSGLHFVGGSGGTCNPQSAESQTLFAAIRRLNLRAYLRRLKEHGYL